VRVTNLQNVRLGQPTFYTSEIDKMMKFYELVGFRENYRFPMDDEPAFVSMNIQWTLFITLASFDAIRYLTGLPNIGKTSNRRFDMTIIVDDVDDAVERLRAAGAPVIMEPKAQPWGDRHAYVMDPEGNYVQITTHFDHGFSPGAEFVPAEQA
jgi:lactoylglutathione lyase